MSNKPFDLGSNFFEGLFSNQGTSKREDVWKIKAKANVEQVMMEVTLPHEYTSRNNAIVALNALDAMPDEDKVSVFLEHRETKTTRVMGVRDVTFSLNW